jgi:carbon starvation protein
MHTIVINSTVDGVLMAVFLGLVAIVVINAAVVCVRSLTSAAPRPTSETPHVMSRIGAVAEGPGEPVLAGAAAADR